MKLNIYEMIGLICGIIGLLLSCVFIGIFPALVGLAFSLLALSQKNTKHGLAIVGLVCSIVALCIGVVVALSFGESMEKKAETITQSNIENSYIYETEESTEGKDVETEAEYRESCQEYNYKDVLRKPEDYVGKRIKITVEISSVHEKSLLNDTKYYFARDDEDGYGYFVGNKYGIFDNREDDSLKLLEDDIITVYGEILDPEYTSSLIVTSTEVFCIDMKYLDFISE